MRDSGDSLPIANADLAGKSVPKVLCRIHRHGLHARARKVKVEVERLVVEWRNALIPEVRRVPIRRGRRQGNHRS